MKEIRKVMYVQKRTLIIASVGIFIGLLVGIIIEYSVQTSQTQDLQNQVSNLQNQISQKNSQIQTLQQQVSDLEALVGPIRKGAWNLIESSEGSSSLVTTDYFYIAGTELRINWTWTCPDPQFGSFSIYLYKEGQDVYTEAFWNLQQSGATFAHNIIASYYYLKILGANLVYWTVKVEVWIPE